MNKFERNKKEGKNNKTESPVSPEEMQKREKLAKFLREEGPSEELIKRVALKRKEGTEETKRKIGHSWGGLKLKVAISFLAMGFLMPIVKEGLGHHAGDSGKEISQHELQRVKTKPPLSIEPDHTHDEMFDYLEGLIEDKAGDSPLPDPEKK